MITKVIIIFIAVISGMAVGHMKATMSAKEQIDELEAQLKVERKKRRSAIITSAYVSEGRDKASRDFWSLMEKYCAVEKERDTLRENFIDYVCSGVQNPAPYCANRTPDCVNCYGWCKDGAESCKGFFPRTKEEE